MEAVLVGLHTLHTKNLSVAMMAWDFVSRRIAPLQDHHEPMWRYARVEDRKRLAHEAMLSSVTMEVMARLFGRLRVPITSVGASPLFIFEDGDELAEGMPVFDELVLV